MQLAVPGYRDRVVHVSLRADEGGLNLDMPAELIEQLAERGRHAGLRLVERFGNAAGDDELSWDNHRWVRFRSTMAALEVMLRDVCEVYADPLPGEMTYAQLVARQRGEPPRSYFWKSPAQRRLALETCSRLCELVAGWQGEPATLTRGAPRPRPELRIRPRI
jgi:hypothetical protein